MILHEETYQKYGYTFDESKSVSKIVCKCDYCFTIFESQKSSVSRSVLITPTQSCSSVLCSKQKREDSMMMKYGVKNSMHHDDLKKKLEESIIEKYNVKNVFQNEDIKDKIKKTNQKNLGVDYPSQSTEVRDKVKNSLLKKYGVDNPNKSEILQDKIKETNIERYGVENPFGSKEIQDKIKETNLERYGVENPIKNKEIKAKAIKTTMDRFGVNNPFSSPIIRKTIRDKFFEKYGTTYPSNCFGKTQKQIQDWLQDLGEDFQTDHIILEGKEIDLLSKEKNIAIEYCGLYWHTELSPTIRDKSYHYFKYKKCLDNNIQLITLFGDEWSNKQDICKSIIQSKLGIFNERLYARKCKIQEISKEDLKSFLNQHHLQGYTRSKVGFGLWFNDKLVAVLSLGSHHRKVGVLVLNRLCFKKNIQIIGGASRLFAMCKAWMKQHNYNEVITWSDNRWSNGDVYKNLGFQLDSNLAPDYSYVKLFKPCERISKQSQKKTNTACPNGVTELEWTMEKGLARIWDCGKIRWKYET